MHKLILWSIFGAIVVGSGALYLLVNDRPEIEFKETVIGEVEVMDKNSKEPLTGRGTLENILALSQNLECTIDYQADAEITGTYFTSQGKMRGDFIVPSGQGDVLSSFIMLDNTMYTWSVVDGQKYGMQFDLDKLELARASGDIPDTREPVPLDAALNYDCKPWISFDGSIFQPPSDIIFQDFSNILNMGMEFGTVYEENGDTASRCESCAQVPVGAGRNECLVAFSCQ